MRSSCSSQKHCSRSQGSLGPGDQQQGQELATEESRAAHGTGLAESQQSPSFHRGKTVLKPDCYWDNSTSTSRLPRDGQMKWGKIKLNETGGEKRYQTGGICGAFCHLTLLSYKEISSASTKTHMVFTVTFIHFIHSYQGISISEASVSPTMAVSARPAPEEASDAHLPWSQLIQWRNTPSTPLPSALTATPCAGAGCNHNQKDRPHHREGTETERVFSAPAPAQLCLLMCQCCSKLHSPRACCHSVIRLWLLGAIKTHGRRLEQPQSFVTGGSRLGEAAQGLKTLYELWKVRNKNSILKSLFRPVSDSLIILVINTQPKIYSLYFNCPKGNFWFNIRGFSSQQLTHYLIVCFHLIRFLIIWNGQISCALAISSE